jgi:hypothetical protein
VLLIPWVRILNVFLPVPLDLPLLLLSLIDIEGFGVRNFGFGMGTGLTIMASLLADAGFGQVHVKRVEGDMLNYYYIIRK